MLHEPIRIKSRLNDYIIKWNTSSDQEFREVFKKCRVGIVDKNVYDIYGEDSETFGCLEHIILQEAEEDCLLIQSASFL